MNSFSGKSIFAYFDDQCRIEKAEIKLESITNKEFFETFKQIAKSLAETYSIYDGASYADAYISILTQAAKDIAAGVDWLEEFKFFEFTLIKRRRGQR